MDDLDLLIDLHKDGPRQGPGSDDHTRLALTLSGLRGADHLKIADIGCGTGAATKVLAEELDAEITGVDWLPAFLARLDETAAQTETPGQIKTLPASMDALPFEDASFDAIWSEGAIYRMGFENGIKAWRRFLKPGGVLAVSELTWFTHERPDEIERHWMEAYPEVATASAKIATLEANGYFLLGYFPLTEICWLDNYYRPMQARFADFLSRNDNTDAAKALVAAEEKEISLYERYSTYVGYGFYVAKRLTN